MRVEKKVTVASYYRLGVSYTGIPTDQWSVLGNSKVSVRYVNGVVKWWYDSGTLPPPRYGGWNEGISEAYSTTQEYRTIYI